MIRHEAAAGPDGDEARLCFPLAPVDTTWERERDAYLAEFIAQRLVEAEATGCTDETRYAAGARRVFEEWNDKRERIEDVDDAQFEARVSALGWALRCMAYSAWHRAPGWAAWFHPQAVRPEEEGNAG